MRSLFARLFLSFSVFTCLQSTAQFSKGTRMAGSSFGSIMFNSGTSEQSVTNIGGTTANLRGFTVQISPSLGWFINEKTAIGVNLVIEPSKERISFEEGGSTFQKDETSRFNLGLGGFVRNYFGQFRSMLPFGQVGLSAGMTNFNQDGFFYGGSGSDVYKETYESKSSGGFFLNAGLTLGVTWMLGDQVGLDLSLGYKYAYNKITMNTTRLRDEGIDGVIEETASNETVSKFGDNQFMLGLGFQVFLQKKKK